MAIIFLLISQGCKEKSDKTKISEGKDTLSTDHRYDKFYDENFLDEPKYYIDTSYFTIPIKDLSKGIESAKEFRINGYYGNRMYSMWRRTYQGIGAYIDEYRGYDGIEAREYIIAIRLDNRKAVYVKWANAVQANGMRTSKLGANTSYVESNLPKEILLKLYPGIVSEIHNISPKLIQMHFGDFYPKLIYNDRKCWPWRYNTIRPKIIYSEK